MAFDANCTVLGEILMFERRLERILATRKFNIEAARFLSDEIHSAESEGSNLSSKEERLWKKLVIRIEEWK